ncbi:MAG: ABC transporter permease, partial [Pseudomonadales bacterium]
SLLLASLWRRPTRTVLTIAALAVAFLLFMLLRAIAAAFAGGVSSEGLDRLIVDSRYSMTENLPLAYVERIRNMDPIDAVTHMTWFAGYVGEPRNTFAIHPVDPESYFDVISEAKIDPDVLAAFVRTRNGAVASKALAERFGWRIGQVIPLESELYPKADGSTSWPLILVGTFDYAPGASSGELLLFQYEHYNESVAYWARDQVYWITARARSPELVEQAIRTIDDEFENSPNPTRSTPEDEYRRQFASQLGDIGRVTTSILGAVFFTIVLLTGNSTLQAYRERRVELAVLKTLGFSDARVALLVLGESLLLCVAGALVGIGLALLLEPGMNANLQGLVGRFRMTGSSAAQAVGIAVALALVVGVPPALAVRRRTIVDGLRSG